MSDIGFSRYVAIGDSQTEGLWDGDDTQGLIGFADRLAATLDHRHPGLLYANLAIRGKRVIDVLQDQLPRALSMDPDLVTVCIGMNDVTRPGRTFAKAMADLDDVYRQLAESGATVVTTTFPDVAKMLPVGRLIGARIRQVNAVIRQAADRHGFGLVDLYNAESMNETSNWSHDRMHASTRGHILFAEAAAEALKLPGSNHDWAQPSGEEIQDSFWQRMYAQGQWTRGLLIPWLWRHARGRSSGDGRDPKYGVLQPVSQLVLEANQTA
ncbi:SGNH/GDSL hydrolase family protein [Mycolicibacterium aichiense]|uniref:Lysophospholipase n=1 Tax=Mycolicibacterium aichiense TaxID=1799 RepID=A0AAD1HSN0_9MYCO|nr:SGNH/GDSL hydrolase family protein [Mycolicibacterium aichiense]MCV7016824.1 SGNH/GDSL hydrolase family protein [Mycolicibacterium aichiense]BBX10754.1 lysophospholipase [Mycolicibacterium aichiense]STZ25589.1 lipolytic enzyme, G-D-S-L [Mycolicibacterium aichiense]